MVVKEFFKDVEYPEDKESIKHIIKEYDKVLEHKLYGFERTKKPAYVIQLGSMAFVYYISICSWISLWIRALYIIPLIISVVCNILLFKNVKKSNYDEKAFYKFHISSGLLLTSFIYGGTFGYETVLFSKWDNSNYIISFCLLIFFSLITCIKYRIGAPKKFIKQYLHTDNKIYSYSTLIIPVVQLSVSIAYFEKPYFLLLICSYIFLVIFIGLMSYAYYEYKQYDKIQELKKEINYIPKERKK